LEINSHYVEAMTGRHLIPVTVNRWTRIGNLKKILRNNSIIIVFPH